MWNRLAIGRRNEMHWNANDVARCLQINDAVRLVKSQACPIRSWAGAVNNMKGIAVFEAFRAFQLKTHERIGNELDAHLTNGDTAEFDVGDIDFANVR